MPLSSGTRLGHYGVTTLLGEGGMGQVWQATDTQLNREVALKILPDAFAADPERLARFTREAQILASLNHPNIAAIYGIEESEGTRALVLELVEGPTLADRIAHGAMPIEDALPIAKQIAEALEAAHEAGVIHRDLKPANIKVREDGTVKVLDFGLAKALDPSPEGDPSESPTLTAAATKMGVIMGTAAYMAPEQAKGKVADKRADVWAFGVVLYEMLTGRRTFEGGDVSEVMAKVITLEPEWDALPTELPPALVTYLRRCLQKDPRERIRDIGDVRLAMAGAFDVPIPPPLELPETPVAVSQLQVWQRPVPVALAVLAALALGGLAVWTLMRPDVIPADLMRFLIVPPDTAPLGFAGARQDLAISPDGSQVVYKGPVPGGGGRQLNLRPIDQLVGGPLRGGEGGMAPFVSPGGEWVGFLASSTILQKVSIFGGPPVTLTESPNAIFGASWGTDDQIIFGTNGAGLFRVPGGGGEPEALTTLDTEQGEVNHLWPFIIPGRDVVVFVIGTGAPLTTGQLAVLDLDTSEVRPLGLAGVSPHYVSTGHLVYAAEDGSVRAVPFDATSLEVTGNPVPLVEGVVVKGSGAADFSISDNGRLVYALGAGGAGLNLTSRLVVTGQDGAGTPLADIAGYAWYPRFSPDGTRVAFAVSQTPGGGGAADLWVLDIERGTRTRLTSEGNNRFYPVWSPDGSQLAFADGAGGTNRVLLTSADGSGEPETLLDRNERQFPTSWVADGNVMTLYTDNPDTARDLNVLAMDGDLTPELFLATPFQERGVSFSPGGQWIAYVSDESGQDEVYVRPYPGPGGQVIISTGGGEEVVWGPDGSELFYRNGDQVMVVEVTTGQTFSAGAPAPLFAAPYALDNAGGGAGNPNYDISPDGAQFIFVEHDSATGVEGVAQITVVLNWFEELKARVPVP